MKLTQISLALLLAATPVLSNAAIADEAFNDEAYLTIGSMELSHEVDLSADFEDGAVQAFDLPELTEANAILDQIINIGSKVWKLVADNKPVVNVSSGTANALPKGALSWTQLAGWQNPKARVYRVAYKNLYGMTVVDFSFRVTQLYGGGVDGKGKYVTMSIVPADLQVAWGYTFNSSVEIPNVVNAGTSKSPIGGIEARINWQIDTVMKHQRQSASYFVRGDGGFVDLSSGTNN